MCIWAITMIEAIEKEVSIEFTSLFDFRLFFENVSLS